MNQPTSISKLPLEPLNIIGQHLRQADYREARAVCRQWNQIFRPLFFQACEFHGKEYTVFDKLLLSVGKPRSKTQKFGHYVRHITACDKLMTMDMMDRLAEECPNIRSIEFNWKSHYGSSVDVRDATRAFREPRYFMETFQSFPLTSLVLSDGSLSDRRSIVRLPPVFDMPYFLRILKHYPTLTKLNLDLTIEGAGIIDVEDIHSLLPNLVELSLLGITKTVPPADLTRVKPPAHTIRKFAVGSGDVFKDASVNKRWIRYIGYKYPNLTDLHLEEDYDWRSFDPRRVISTDYDSTPLVDILPKLERLILRSAWDKEAKICAPTLRGLRDINIMGTWSFRDDPLLLQELIDALSPTVTSLAIKIKTRKEYIPILGQCQHLRHLELSGEYLYSRKEEPFRVQELLSACPRLETLHLQDLYLDTTVNESVETQEHPLKRLELQKVRMQTESKLEFVAKLCPHVKYLVFERCTWMINEVMDPGRVHLDLPKHRLELIEVRGGPLVISECPMYLMDTFDFMNEEQEDEAAKRKPYTDYILESYIGIKQSCKTDNTSNSLMSFAPLYATTRPLGITQAVLIKTPHVLRAIESFVDKTPLENYKTPAGRCHERFYEQSQHLEFHRFMTVHCHSIEQFFIDGVRIDLENPDYVRPTNPLKNPSIKKDKFASKWYKEPVSHIG